MKVIHLAQTSILFVGLISCGTSLFSNENEYLFNVGDNFLNNISLPTKPEVPDIESDFDNQIEEDLTLYKNVIDISNYNKGETINITKGGEYIIEGENFNISFSVDCEDEVTFILNNTKLMSKFNNPINVINALKFNIYIPSKTKNYISGSLIREQSAIIYVNSDFKIYGDGYLYLNSFPDELALTDKPLVNITKSLLIENTHVKSSYSNGITFNSLGVIKLDNAKLDVGYSNGLFLNNDDIFINDSILINNSNSDAIKCKNINIINSSLYITTIGDYSKIELDQLDLNDDTHYFIKNEADYVRVDLSSYNGVEALYKLNNSAICINVENDINLDKSIFYLDSDNYGLKASNIYALNNMINLKASNVGLFASNEIKLIKDNNYQNYLKIVSSYKGILAKYIELDGGNNYIVSSDIGIDTLNQEELGSIIIKNQERLNIDSLVKGVNVNTNLTIEDSLVTFFSGAYKEAKGNESQNVFTLTNSTLISLDENSAFPKSKFENVYDIKLGKEFEKHSALHFYSDDFITSLILPKSYDSLTLSIASDKLKECNYVISKDGYIDYKFNDNLSLNDGYPFGDTHLKDVYLFNSKLSY